MDYYATLEVTRQATTDDIKKAYRKLAMKWHPDRNPGDDAAVEQFKKVNEAYETLSDPNKRARYDMGGIKVSVPKPAPKKPEKKKDPKDVAWENRKSGFTYADAPRPKVDLWGNPIKDEVKEPGFKDTYAGLYESESAPDLR